ncbi:hypothetical protein QZJ86_15350 [Methylomonas montana]|uniref:hypothetical protein n=1 Tax=Methylomonas montana TaxID=3058963 RepID=UPI0026597763|nr:hypothetical protein [Methylomonas montana]WKJ89387.1 hypothetical protein QZJ86_15350 [Methylomonas montana]
MMEINTTNPQPNALVTQLPARDQKAGGVEELAERKKLAKPNSEAENSEQRSVADTVSFSSESQRLAQSANTVNVDSPVNREQAQQVLGQLISGISSNPGLALATYGSVSRASVNTLLN